MKWLWGILWLSTIQVQAVDIAYGGGATNAVGTIVARWDDVMLQHVQLTPLEPRLQRRFREQMFWPNTLLLHSSLETGRVKTLLHTETGQEWMTRPGTVWHSRIIGVHVDAERIYVAQWSASERGRGLAFLLPPKDRPKTPLRPVRGRYQLHVFRKTDGGLLHSVAVPGGPNGVPPATFKAGPLKPMPNGVECFGTRAAFKGDKPVTAKP